jgi:DNA-binding CsgD family transcriptional regulator
VRDVGIRSKPNRAEMVRVMRLLADVAALKPDPVAQHQLLVDGLNAVVGTNQSFLYVVDGWWPGESPRFLHRALTTDRDPVFLQYMAEFGSRLPLTADPFAPPAMRDPGDEQAWTFADVLPDRRTERQYPEFMDIIHGGRVSDGVVSFYRVPRPAGLAPEADPHRIIGFGMHQFGNAGRLRARQVALVRFAIHELRALAGRGHLTLPPPPQVPLPPRLRAVLHRLLAGQAPKSIARAMGLSLWTVREHVQRLYRLYDVSGRDELMARFVRPPNGADPAGGTNGDAG